MVRCSTKRKRGSDLASPTAANITVNNSPKNAASAIRIGYDSPINELPDCHSKVCSIRDDIEPTSRQSSLLSFFTKEKRAKQRPKSKHANNNLTSMSGVRCVQNNRALSSSPLPPSSSSLSNTMKENPSIKGSMTPSLMCSSTSKSHQKTTKSLTQVFIDCGQSKFGQILCKKCGMLYMPGISEDENQHKRLCQAYTLGIPCNRGTVKGGKKVDTRANENDTNCNNEATIVSWRPCVKIFNSKKSKGQQEKTQSHINDRNEKDRPSQWPLLAQIISKDLGTHEETTLNHLTNEIVFLYIGKNIGHENNKPSITNKPNGSNRYRILGVATVQLLGQVHAYRMINLYERSLTPAPEAKLGIGLLWTHPAARMRGVATKLVNAARENTVFGMRVARQDVAFSNPTQAGYNFALRYRFGDRNNDADIGTSYTARSTDDSIDLEKQKEDVDSSISISRRGPLVYEMNL